MSTFENQSSNLDLFKWENECDGLNLIHTGFLSAILERHKTEAASLWEGVFGSSMEKGIHSAQINETIQWIDFSKISYCVVRAQKRAERENILFGEFNFSSVSIYNWISVTLIFKGFEDFICFSV